MKRNKRHSQDINKKDAARTLRQQGYTIADIASALSKSIKYVEEIITNPKIK